VKWENTTNEEVLERAREEIRKSWRETCDLNKNRPQAGSEAAGGQEAHRHRVDLGANGKKPEPCVFARGRAAGDPASAR
jgi:hypothetical protein